MFLPGVPNDAEDEAARERRLDARDFRSSRYWRFVFVGGFGVLAAWAILWLADWPGTGLVLVPIGLLMILASGIRLLLERL